MRDQAGTHGQRRKAEAAARFAALLDLGSRSTFTLRNHQRQAIVAGMDIGDVNAGLEHLKVALQSGAEAFKLWRSIRGSEPTPEQEHKIDSLFQDAETERQLAMASIGKAFDYQLCKCTIPPQVCTMTGFSESGQEQSRCPKCGQEYPAPVTARAQTAISDFDPFEC